MIGLRRRQLPWCVPMHLQLAFICSWASTRARTASAPCMPAVCSGLPCPIADACTATIETQALGIDTRAHDIRFVEDNWESPVLGAWGLGWEVSDWWPLLSTALLFYPSVAGGSRVGLSAGGLGPGLVGETWAPCVCVCQPVLELEHVSWA